MNNPLRKNPLKSIKNRKAGAVFLSVPVVILLVLSGFLPASSAVKKEPARVVPQDNLNGSIIGIPLSKEVNATYINTGLVHGAEPGMQFGVYRNGSLIAVLEITIVMQRMSAVKIVQMEKGESLQIGDQVALLRGAPVRLIPKRKPAEERPKLALGPEKPPAYLPQGPANERIALLEKRVDELEKLLAKTYAMIPQAGPQELAVPPLPEFPVANAPSATTLALNNAPKEEVIEGPPTAELEKKTAKPKEEEVDLWKADTPYDKIPETVPQTQEEKSQDLADTDNEWSWGTPYQNKKVGPKVRLDVALLDSDGDEYQGGAKLTARSNFVDCKNWELKIVDQDGKAVRTYSGKDKLPTEVEWDGKNTASEKVKNGLYAYVFKAVSIAGDPAAADGEIPSRNPTLLEEKDWKADTLYADNAPGTSSVIKAKRKEDVDYQSLVLNSGKILFAIALLLLVL